MFLGGCPLGGGIAGLLRRNADTGADVSARSHRHTGANAEATPNAEANACSHGGSCPIDAPCLNASSLGAPRAGRG